MENIIYQLEKQISKVKLSQNSSISIIRQINLMNDEANNYALLSQHTQNMTNCEEQLQELEYTKKQYEQLLESYLNFIKDH